MFCFKYSEQIFSMTINLFRLLLSLGVHLHIKLWVISVKYKLWWMFRCLLMTALLIPTENRVLSQRICHIAPGLINRHLVLHCQRQYRKKAGEYMKNKLLTAGSIPFVSLSTVFIALKGLLVLRYLEIFYFLEFSQKSWYIEYLSKISSKGIRLFFLFDWRIGKQKQQSQLNDKVAMRLWWKNRMYLNPSLTYYSYCCGVSKYN